MTMGDFRWSIEPWLDALRDMPHEVRDNETAWFLDRESEETDFDMWIRWPKRENGSGLAEGDGKCKGEPMIANWKDTPEKTIGFRAIGRHATGPVSRW